MQGRVSLQSVGFVAPGLADAEALARHFDGEPLGRVDRWRPSPASLPRRQARRLSSAIALAVSAAEQIGAVLPPSAGWVFASSIGEGETLNEILGQLSQPDIMLQPLRFQNAVHNAAQGQWSIIAGATGPATSIAARCQTAGAGLLKAVMQVMLERLPVGLVVFDTPLPAPLHSLRPIDLPVAAALALAPARSDGGNQLEIDLSSGAAATSPAESGASEMLVASGNPACQLLPLLSRVHRRDSRPVILALPGGAGLRVRWCGNDAR